MQATPQIQEIAQPRSATVDHLNLSEDHHDGAAPSTIPITSQNLSNDYELSDMDVWLEAERLQVIASSAEHAHVFTDDTVQAELLTARTKRRIPRPEVSQYVLDFGPIIAGDLRSHVVSITNTGIFASNFSIDHTYLQNSGFMESFFMFFVIFPKIKNIL